jgi:hypothetical protein
VPLVTSRVIDEQQHSYVVSHVRRDANIRGRLLNVGRHHCAPHLTLDLFRRTMKCEEGNIAGRLVCAEGNTAGHRCSLGEDKFLPNSTAEDVMRRQRRSAQFIGKDSPKTNVTT